MLRATAIYTEAKGRMNDSQLLRLIYAELRQTADGQIPAGDLLRLAHIILLAHQTQFEEEYERKRESKPPFHTLEVDEAMRDGGWRILAFENRYLPRQYELPPEARIRIREQLNKYLGKRWQRLFPPG